MSDEKRFDSLSRSQTTETTLDMLDAVESGEPLSQRDLAQKLGVALGLTNALLKRCGRKGLLKVREVPGRRFAYYLTPKGFAEKSRLTAEYLTSSLQFFRRARDEYTEASAYCRIRGWKRIVLFGDGDLSEIAVLSLKESDIQPLAIVDTHSNHDARFDVPVVRSLEEAGDHGAFDAVMITESRHPQEAFDFLQAVYPKLPIVTPRLLRVNRPPMPAE